MQKLIDILNFNIQLTKNIQFEVKDILLVIIVMSLTSLLLNFIRRVLSRKLPNDDKIKFKILFGYGKWLVYLIIFLLTLHAIGINVTAVFAASAALLIGVGLALQTLFQDIIAGILILIDQVTV